MSEPQSVSLLRSSRPRGWGWEEYTTAFGGYASLVLGAPVGALLDKVIFTYCAFA